MIRPYNGIWPRLGVGAFVDESAQVIGDVDLGDHASVWMNAVIRGDIHFIKIGTCTNIQDNCVLHVQEDEFPVIVGDHVTIGHLVALHGCKVEGHCLIGMGATLLNGAHIGEGSIVAAGAVVTEGMRVPPRSMVMGVPGRVTRTTTERERDGIRASAEGYVAYKRTYSSAVTEHPTNGNGDTTRP